MTVRPTKAVDGSLLRDMIKKELVSVTDDGSIDGQIPIEVSETELNTSINRQREEERISKMEVEQVLLDEKAVLARDHLRSVCELLVDLNLNCRLLLESNLTRVDK